MEEEEEEGGVEVEEEKAGKQGSGSGSDEENLQDKYKDEPVLDIIDTEDEKKAKSEEQVNRILDTFRNHGVVANPASKRKFDHEAATNAEEEAKRKKIAKKERRKLKTSKKAAEAENRARNGEGSCCLCPILDFIADANACQQKNPRKNTERGTARDMKGGKTPKVPFRRLRMIG